MIMEDVSEDGRVHKEREKLTILQRVGEIEEDNSLSRHVGIGSRSQGLFMKFKRCYSVVDSVRSSVHLTISSP